MQSMQVIEQQDQGCRLVYWELPDHGWEDVARRIDPFLARAIHRIAAEYVGEPVPWLEVNHWPCSGRLIVFPSQDGPHGNRGERICFQLSSRYLENEFARIGDSLPALEQGAAWAALSGTVWEQVRGCFLEGQASRELREARKVHRLRLAAFDYDFGEGLFRLSELDKEATAEMQRELDAFKRRYGVGASQGTFLKGETE